MIVRLFTLVTKRLKLLDSKGRPRASLCVLNSLTRPSPILFVEAGNFGKLAGRSDDSKRSETLVDNDGVGTVNFLGCCWEAPEPVPEGGGKEGRWTFGGRGFSGTSTSTLRSVGGKIA